MLLCLGVVRCDGYQASKWKCFERMDVVCSVSLCLVMREWMLSYGYLVYFLFCLLNSVYRISLEFMTLFYEMMNSIKVSFENVFGGLENTWNEFNFLLSDFVL